MDVSFFSFCKKHMDDSFFAKYFKILYFNKNTHKIHMDDTFFILYVFCKKTIIHVYFVCIFILYCILLACKFAAKNEYGG